jgi:hypothetical protein
VTKPEESMTVAQAITIASFIEAMKEKGLDPIWHFNLCGCCVSVHENVSGDKVTGGWVINRDGEAFKTEDCE